MVAAVPTDTPAKTLEIPRYPGSKKEGRLEMRADPLEFYLNLRRKHGPVVRFPYGTSTGFLVSDPDLIQRVLVTDNHHYPKGFGRLGRGPSKQPLVRAFGNGLITSRGDFHRRQRRLIQPVFHRERIAAYGDLFAAIADASAARWTDGQAIDVPTEMTDLTFQIVTKTLFDVEPDERFVTVVSQGMQATMTASVRAQVPFAELRDRLPLAANRRRWEARDRLHRMVDGLIAERRQAGDAHERTDLLSLLLSTRDADTGEPMNDRQVRDEALAILIAGHETTANALNWTWHLLAGHPDVEARLHAEVDALPDRLPSAADLPRLDYTAQVLAESMRLYPPIWMMARRPRTKQRLGQYVIPAGGTVIVSPYVVHHDPRYYPDPDRFDPDRWLPESIATRPRFAYLPFGSGPRKCIGDGFAKMEGVLILATIARVWSLRPPVGARPVRTLPQVTLRPRGKLPLVAVRRG